MTVIQGNCGVFEFYEHKVIIRTGVSSGLGKSEIAVPVKLDEEHTGMYLSVFRPKLILLPNINRDLQ